jgi:hypothetical protein
MNLTPYPQNPKSEKEKDKNMRTCGWHLLLFQDMQCLQHFFFLKKKLRIELHGNSILVGPATILQQET